MRKWIVGSSLVVVAGLVVLFFATGPDDTDLINQAINESVVASKEGKPGSVLEHLSRSLSFNGMAVTDRTEIAKYIRLARPEVVFSTFHPEIDGDTAKVKADVSVKINYFSLQLDETVRDVEVTLARETGFRWLVFPASKWRITSVSAPELPLREAAFP